MLNDTKQDALSFNAQLISVQQSREVPAGRSSEKSEASVEAGEADEVSEEESEELPEEPDYPEPKLLGILSAPPLYLSKNVGHAQDLSAQGALKDLSCKHAVLSLWIRQVFDTIIATNFLEKGGLESLSP